MPAPLLTPDQQDTLIAAAYQSPGYATAAIKLGLNPESVQTTKRLDADFAARLADVVAFQSEQVGDAMTAFFFETTLPTKERMGLGKQLLRQRLPGTWKAVAEKAKKTTQRDDDGDRRQPVRRRGRGSLYPPQAAPTDEAETTDGSNDDHREPGTSDSPSAMPSATGVLDGATPARE